MLRVVAVDDEPSALADISRRIRAHPGLRLVGTADSSGGARRVIAEQKPDAVFLDVEMPGGTAFAMVQALPEAPKIVFVTAHSRHAAAAFDVEAVDFLVKPIVPERFAIAVRRLEKAVRVEKSVRAIARRPVTEATITVAGHREQHVVRVNEIRALIAEGDYTRLLLARSASLLAGQSLGKLEKLLPSPPFVRLGRSLILNLARVTATQPLGGAKLSVRCEERDEPLVLGRTAATALRRYLADSKV
jgi:two-component system, LytTR family, response regulator